MAKGDDRAFRDRQASPFLGHPATGDESAKHVELLRTIFEHVPVMISVIGPANRLELVNPEWERTLGWTLRELQEDGLDIFAECYPDAREREAVLDFTDSAPSGTLADFRTRVRDGRVIETTWARVRLSDGTRIGIGMDVTDRVRARDALQVFSRQLLEVQEAERRHLARELHDEIGQQLTALMLLLDPSAHGSPAALARSLEGARTLTRDLLRRVRRLSLDLRPSTLDDLGLLPTLATHFERYTESTGIRVSFTHAGLAGRRFQPEIETAAYRIVQEALTNVARHAAVNDVTVRVTAGETALVLEVADEGRGFDASGLPHGAASSGLLGMQERAKLLGGRLGVDSAPGGGVRLRGELPLSRSSDPKWSSRDAGFA